MLELALTSLMRTLHLIKCQQSISVSSESCRSSSRSTAFHPAQLTCARYSTSSILIHHLHRRSIVYMIVHRPEFSPASSLASPSASQEASSSDLHLHLHLHLRLHLHLHLLAHLPECIFTAESSPLIPTLARALTCIHQSAPAATATFRAGSWPAASPAPFRQTAILGPS
jgi:hypothetical protein